MFVNPPRPIKDKFMASKPNIIELKIVQPITFIKNDFVWAKVHRAAGGR